MLESFLMVFFYFSGAKMSILEEMYRNKEAVSSLGSDHKMKFFGWKNVLRVAKSVGGEFDSLASLTSYIKHQLTSPAEAKIQSRERINELDTLVFKIYDDLDSSGLDYEPEFNLPESGLNQQQHQQQHVCRLCQVSYQRFDQLRGHQQMVHGQDPEADIDRKCRICGLDVGLEKAAVRAHFRQDLFKITVFTRVGTYVQRGSKFCFVVLVADTLIKILHYCPI
jgi:hypothetical protein